MIRRIFRAAVLFLGKLSGDSARKVYEEDFDACASTYDEVVTRPVLAAVSAEKLGKLAVSPGARCLELGCGTGQVTELLARAAGSGAVAACDISGAMAALAAARLARAKLRAEIQSRDMVEFLDARPEGSADLVVSFWAMEYRDPAKVLRGVRRVLAEGGRVALLVNTRDSLAELQAAVTPVLARRPWALKRIPPLNFPAGARRFRALAEGAGLRTLALGEEMRAFRFASGKDLVRWMRDGGPAAGFRGSIREKYREDIFRRIEEIVDKSGGLVVRFRYLYYEGTSDISR